MKLIQVTDLHLVNPGEKHFGLDPLARLEACIADINRNHADADLVVFSGDLTDRGEAIAYEALKQRLATLVPPYRLMIGNHDDRAVFLEAFPEAADENGFIQTHLDLPHGRVLLLDTVEQGQIEGRLCDSRLAWLDERLGEAEGRPAYVFTHHPPFDIHMPTLDELKLMDHAALYDVLARHGAVRHIFSGHVHRPVGGSWRGIPISTIRGTNHQSALVFSGDYQTSTEPPAYAVIIASEDSVVVHHHDFLQGAAA
ncbi:phosphodiesterase [Pseudaminobacter soli (ex Li et al. 2025)]|uniref:Phosphodiesterase n=1 Tax=Pseudaminobacter soli (ex Li et al. 2025) TaxID=1295366 RepID=A0A2P7SEA8_9HYPH|nr:phosphodiesterase [Mesorhizobium soli]PSJ60846.1 phosphodiesterase [Mesorhizobium soli]